MLRDQRTMSGIIQLETKEDVERFWYTFAANQNFPGFLGRASRDLLDSAATIDAYVSAGRWVADCITPGCRGGISCWPDHVRACCLDCGYIFKVKFPRKDVIARAEASLLVRPEEFQNWRPDQGETPKVLEAENILTSYPAIVIPEETG